MSQQYINVFQDELFQTQTPTHTNYKNLILTHDRENTYLKRDKKIQNSLQDFLNKWKLFTNNLFEGFDFSNVFVAGGSILGCLLSTDDVKQYNSSDIDMFLYGYTEQQANDKVKYIYEFLKKKSPNTTICRTKYTVSFIPNKPYHRPIQVVLSIFNTPLEVIDGFDVDCCCVGFDGQQVYATTRSRLSIINGINTIDMENRSNTYETRLFKYSRRGFAVELGESFSPDKVPSDLFSQELRVTAGLQKLLLLQYHYILNNYQDSFDIKTIFRGDQDFSQIDLPKDITHNNVAKYLTHKDQGQFFTNNKKVHKHRHIIVVGEGSVFSGKSSWCKLCANGDLPDINQVSGPICWKTKNPGRQNILHKITRDEWYDLSTTSQTRSDLNTIKDAIVDNNYISQTSQVFTPRTFKRQASTDKDIFLSDGAHLVSLASVLGSEKSLESLLNIDGYRKFVNLACENGYYPLHYAVVGGSLECVMQLLSKGALPMYKSFNSYKMNILFLASMHRQTEIYQFLSKKYPYLLGNQSSLGKKWMSTFHYNEANNTPKPNGDISLFESIREGSAVNVKEIIKSQGANILSQVDNISQSAMHHAIFSPKPNEMVKLLLSYDSSLLENTYPNKFGQTIQDYCLVGLTSIQSFSNYNSFVGSIARSELKSILNLVREINRKFCFSQIPVKYKESPIQITCVTNKTSSTKPSSGIGGKFLTREEKGYNNTNTPLIQQARPPINGVTYQCVKHETLGSIRIKCLVFLEYILYRLSPKPLLTEKQIFNIRKGILMEEPNNEIISIFQSSQSNINELVEILKTLNLD